MTLVVVLFFCCTGYTSLGHKHGWSLAFSLQAENLSTVDETLKYLKECLSQKFVWAGIPRKSSFSKTFVDAVNLTCLSHLGQCDYCMDLGWLYSYSVGTGLYGPWLAQ